MLVSIQERFIIKMVRVRYILTKEIIEIKKNVNESMFIVYVWDHPFCDVRKFLRFLNPTPLFVGKRLHSSKMEMPPGPTPTKKRTSASSHKYSEITKGLSG